MKTEINVENTVNVRCGLVPMRRERTNTDTHTHTLMLCPSSFTRAASSLAFSFLLASLSTLNDRWHSPNPSNHHSAVSGNAHIATQAPRGCGMKRSSLFIFVVPRSPLCLLQNIYQIWWNSFHLKALIPHIAKKKYDMYLSQPVAGYNSSPTMISPPCNARKPSLHTLLKPDTPEGKGS